MQSRFSIFVIMGFALALIVLGFYLYQTEPENDTTNFTDAVTVVVEAETAPEPAPESDVESDVESEAETAPAPESDVESDVESEAETAPAPESDVESDVESEAESESGALLIELVHATADGSLVIGGYGQAGDVISLYHDGAKLAETTANASGAWTLVPNALLDAGGYLFMLQAKEGADSDVAVIVVIPAADEQHALLIALVPLDDSAKQAELLQSPLADGASSAIRVTSAPATQPITAQNTAPKTTSETASMTASNTAPHVSITAIEALSATRMQIRGAVRGDTTGTGAVAVSIDGTEAETSRQGNQYTAEGTIPSRAHFPINVTQKDADGKTIATARIKVSKAQLDASALEQGLVVVQKDDALWRIAFRAYGKGVRYIDIFQRNKDKIRDPGLIYPDQIFIVPKR